MHKRNVNTKQQQIYTQWSVREGGRWERGGGGGGRTEDLRIVSRLASHQIDTQASAGKTKQANIYKNKQYRKRKATKMGRKEKRR